MSFSNGLRQERGSPSALAFKDYSVMRCPELKYWKRAKTVSFYEWDCYSFECYRSEMVWWLEGAVLGVMPLDFISAILELLGSMAGVNVVT